MARTYAEVEQTLNQEIGLAKAACGRDVNEFIEAKGVRRAIRAILSLAPSAPLPGTVQEHELFEKVVFLMSLKSRKWLSETQVALPYAEMRLEKQISDAELKSRVWDQEVDEMKSEGKGARLIPVGKHLLLREYFMGLLASCIFDDERERHPHLLTLVETMPNVPGVRGVNRAGVDASAWYLFRFYCETIRGFEKSSRSSPSSSDFRVVLDVGNVEKQYEQQLKTFQAKVADAPWGAWSHQTAPSQDSLFARLFVHASLNRMMLELWALERRSKQALLSQEPLVRELEVALPEGIVSLLLRHSSEGSVDYRRFIQEALHRSISTGGRSSKDLTPNVLGRIEAQVDAVMASAALLEFASEVEVNTLMLRCSSQAQALLWLALTWSYLHGTKLVDDDPRVHASEVAPISRRSKLVQDGQGMVTLRRFLVTLLNSYQWLMPSAARLLLHENYYSTVRRTVLRVLEQNFKTTSLAQWYWPEYAIVQTEHYSHSAEIKCRAGIG